MAVAVALPVSVLRVERRVGVSPSPPLSCSCFVDTHTAWFVKSSGTIMSFRSCDSTGTAARGLGLAQFGAFHVRDFVPFFFIEMGFLNTVLRF